MPGLNIVLATRSKSSKPDESDRKRTRNGSGKSSLVDIFRFMLGGDVPKNSVLGAPALQDDTFFLTFDLLGEEATVSRSPVAKSRLDVLSGFERWPVRPDIHPKTNAVTISRPNWNDLLGRAFFGLPPADEVEARSNLTHGACLSFFVRRSRDGAFDHWVLTYRAQSSLQQAVPLFHLLGLDPGVPLKFVRLAETRKAAAELKRAIAEGLVTETIGSQSHLRNELVKARRRVERTKSRLAGADVIEFYGEYEREAAQLDAEIRAISDANYVDEQAIEDLVRASQDEAAPAVPDIARLYEEASVVLPGVSLRRYEEVKAFHKAIVTNRKAHLSAELDAARRRVRERAELRDRLVARHQQILELISSGVSWGHYRKLERELIESESQVTELSRRLELAERFERTRVNLRAEKIDAERALRSDLSERRETVEDAISVFQELSAQIYDVPAEFDIAPTANGPVFAIKQPARMAEGINQMQIFTFDLMLSILSAKRGHWPGFLVHDSAIFDGVDPRQTGSALMLGHERTLALGGQYIVTMNSDHLAQTEQETGLDFSRFVLDPVLSDVEGGGLFGFSFEHDVDNLIPSDEAQ
jgi:uncharacterized protein YydD (DUF2326 family)